MVKKRIGFVTSSILLKTGFSTNIRALLPYLYKTGKYELFHLNQSIGDGEPNFQRFPWHNEGVFKRGAFNEELFQRDPGYQRLVAYGNLAVESFLVNNKLDALIHIEDGWSSVEDYYINAKWFPFMKNNFLQWTTIDSLPVLPLYKHYAEKCPDMWVWASFAERALKAENPEKFGSVKTVFGCLNADEYSPISLEEKNELRQRNKIDLDTTIFIQLGRNQLRKLFPASLESFKKFKSIYPEKKAKLLFHCSWSEPGGWPLERLIKDFGVSPADVLTTYFCRACGGWEVKPFTGEDQKCGLCQSDKSQVTAGITSGISNRELSKVYGIADASISAFTSGGMEYTNPQSLLCGLPLLCSDYSSGEDFVKNDFVFKLDGSFTYEVQTGFKKHVPNQDTMVSFFQKICTMSVEERQNIGAIGREWALANFDVDVAGKHLENWIDSRPEHNWDFKVPEVVDLKNPNAQIPQISDNGEWVKTLYKDILKMTVDENDEGWKHWMKSLQMGMRREEIHNYFKKVGTEENAKHTKPVNFEDILNPNDKKRLLLIMPESIGDVFLLTALFRSIREQYPRPDWSFYFATKAENVEIIGGNENLDYAISYVPEMDNHLWLTGMGDHKGYFNVVLHPYFGTQRSLDYLNNAQDNIGLDLNYASSR